MGFALSSVIRIKKTSVKPENLKITAEAQRESAIAIVDSF